MKKIILFISLLFIPFILSGCSTSLESRLLNNSYTYTVSTTYLTTSQTYKFLGKGKGEMTITYTFKGQYSDFNTKYGYDKPQVSNFTYEIRDGGIIYIDTGTAKHEYQLYKDDNCLHDTDSTKSKQIFCMSTSDTL